MKNPLKIASITLNFALAACFAPSMFGGDTDDDDCMFKFDDLHSNKGPQPAALPKTRAEFFIGDSLDLDDEDTTTLYRDASQLVSHQKATAVNLPESITMFGSDDGCMFPLELAGVIGIKTTTKKPRSDSDPTSLRKPKVEGKGKPRSISVATSTAIAIPGSEPRKKISPMTKFLDEITLSTHEYNNRATFFKLLDNACNKLKISEIEDAINKIPGMSRSFFDYRANLLSWVEEYKEKTGKLLYDITDVPNLDLLFGE